MGFILSSEHLYEQPKEIPEPFVPSHWIISEPPGSEKKTVRRRQFSCQNWYQKCLPLNKTKQPRHTLILPSFWRTSLQGFVMDTIKLTYSELYSNLFPQIGFLLQCFLFYMSLWKFCVCVYLFLWTVCNFPQILMGVCDENKLKNHHEIVL